ncbi:hypothetical protein DRQ33_03460 [bacterium]|nr:MAG: hypothetical protein DRQ33_03460 [bacterium]
MHFYVHIPFCRKKCNYCAFYSVIYKKGVESAFLSAILNEIDLMSNVLEYFPFQFNNGHLHKNNTLYIGGGTPSLMKPSYINKIKNRIKKRFHILKFDEFTIEVNPESITANKLNQYEKIGVSRISVGIQSLNDMDLKILGRIHNSHQAMESLNLILSSAIPEISVDLLYGLPNSEIEQIIQCLKKVIAVGIKHISLYMLTPEPNTILESEILAGKVNIPSADNSSRQYYLAMSFLEEFGYIPYEVSNFAMDGHRCIHNIGYWKYEPYLSFGPSAHSFNGIHRWANASSIQQYIDYFASINNTELSEIIHQETDEQNYPNLLAKLNLPLDFIETLTAEQKISEIVMLGLRTEEGVELNRTDKYADRILQSVESLIDKNIVRFDGERIWIPSTKRLLADGIAKQIFQGMK